MLISPCGHAPLLAGDMANYADGCGRRVALAKFLSEQFLKPNMEILSTEAEGN